MNFTDLCHIQTGMSERKTFACTKVISGHVRDDEKTWTLTGKDGSDVMVCQECIDLYHENGMFKHDVVLAEKK